MKRNKAGGQEGGGRGRGNKGGEEESKEERGTGERRMERLLPPASCCCAGSHSHLCSVMVAVVPVFRLKSGSMERGPLLAHLNKQSVSAWIFFFYFHSENTHMKQYIIL